MCKKSNVLFLVLSITLVENIACVVMRLCLDCSVSYWVLAKQRDHTCLRHLRADRTVVVLHALAKQEKPTSEVV